MIMQLLKNFLRPKGLTENGGMTKVGWLLDAPSGSVLYYAPERVRTTPGGPTHAKSAARCPAVVEMEARHFLIRCPFDLHLALARTKEGQWGLQNKAGAAGGVRSARIKSIVHMVAPEEWRHPDRPMLQINAPYRFVADEPVYLTQMAPFMHYESHALPGTVFGGRFPVHLWPRALMWAFEWHDLTSDLVLKRGAPWFYAIFETNRPDRPVKLVEAEMTPELERFAHSIDGVDNYTNRTFSLFENAAARRPRRLLVERSGK
jgi:hypothetical protein